MSGVPFKSMCRRDFLETLGVISMGATAVGALPRRTARARPQSAQKNWEPVSDRKSPTRRSFLPSPFQSATATFAR